MHRLLAFLFLFALAAPLHAQQTADVLTVVDEPPELIGGIEGLADQIRYPKLAKLAGIEGRVFVRFVVDEQGAVTDAEIAEGVDGGGLNEEALRVVRQARFTPGRHEGEPAKVRFTLPVAFVLPNDDPVDQ